MGNREINLERGIVVSAEDEDLLETYKWWISNGGYAVRGSYKLKKTFFMHRTVLERQIGREMVAGELVDHINSNKRDNRRENLRLADIYQNQWNKRSNCNSSGYKGIYAVTGCNSWAARITVKGKKIALGSFETPEEAHEAYKAAAIKYFGEFARFE